MEYLVDTYVPATGPFALKPAADKTGQEMTAGATTATPPIVYSAVFPGFLTTQSPVAFNKWVKLENFISKSLLVTIVW